MNNIVQDALDRLLLLISKKKSEFRELKNKNNCVFKEYKALKEKNQKKRVKG